MSQKIARVYLRVSTTAQDLERQQAIIEDAKAQGYYIAGTYSEKASGVRADRPELQRMIAELQPGDAVICERLDRLTRLPLEQAEALIQSIQEKGARLAIPGVVDLSEISANVDPNSTAAIVLADTQRMLLRIMLKAAHEDYETRRRRAAEGIAIAKAQGKFKGRAPNTTTNMQIVKLRTEGVSIAETAKRLSVSPATVKRVWAAHRKPS
ncbi:recombinase family protein [Salmonella enterica]|nr:recombinase family protein [Salmonella enterica]